MNRRDLIRTTLLAAGAAAPRGSIAESLVPAENANPKRQMVRKTSDRKMNILWICTDEQRANTIPGLNNPNIITPHLNKFMADSITFTNAFVQCPICSPSLAPALLEAAGVAIPPGAMGRSLTTLLKGTTTQHHDSVYIEFYDAVRTTIRSRWPYQHKLAFYQALGTGELYNLVKDPGEVNNLWNQSVQRHAGADDAASSRAPDREPRLVARLCL
jgi:arylsulfatase A-like enzyme